MRTAPLNLKVRFVPTDRTDVLCVACNGFGCQLVIALATGVEGEAGIHTKCVDVVRVKRAPRES